MALLRFPQNISISFDQNVTYVRHVWFSPPLVVVVLLLFWIWTLSQGRHYSWLYGRYVEYVIAKDVTNKMCICLSFVDLYNTVDNTVNVVSINTWRNTRKSAHIRGQDLYLYFFFFFLYMYVDFLIFSGDTVDTTIPDAFQFDSV